MQWPEMEDLLTERMDGVTVTIGKDEDGFVRVNVAHRADEDVRISLDGTPLVDTSEPAPAKATVVKVDTGQVIDIEGYGRRRIDVDLGLVEAAEDLPTVALCEIGSVLFVSGHGHQLVELDTDLDDERGFFPVLSALPVSD